MIETMNEAARGYLDEAAARALNKFRDAVRPIYGATERGDPDHIGSAVLVEIAGRRCLLTAAHVIDHNSYTSLYVGADEFVLIEVEALVTQAPGGDRDADHADFAIYPLSSEDLEKLSTTRFITASDFSPNRGSGENHGYTCLGFPNSKNKVEPYKTEVVIPQLGNYSSFGRPASKLAKIATDHDHVLVEFSGKRARDTSGKIVSAYRFKGFSGGAIVDLGVVTPEGFSLRDDPKLAAILIEAHKAEHVILGTRLSSIIAACEGKL